MEALMNKIRENTRIGVRKPSDLSHGDHPRAQLVANVLNGDNFLTWSKAVKFALGAKNKLGFISGKLPQPTDDPEEADKWMRSDYMVRCWILNSMKESISSSFKNVVSAAQLWQELNERFGENNEPLLYQLRRDLANLTQGTDSLVDYFGKMKTIWDDILNLEEFTGCTCQKCTCNVNSKIQTADNKYKLTQFLMGLNDAFENIRGHILSMDPVPSINRAYHLVQQFDRQKRVVSGVSSVQESSALYVNRNSGKDGVMKKYFETKISLEINVEDVNLCIKEFEEELEQLVLRNASKYMVVDSVQIHTIIHKEEEEDDNKVENDKIDDQETCDVIADFLEGLKIDVRKSHSDVPSSSIGSGSVVVKTSPLRCIGHYNSRQKILLVGEGDFSFAASLATAFGSASNLTATSLDDRDTVIKEYSRAEKNLMDLEDRGAIVIHQVDVYTMKKKRQLKKKLFDRIVFNFPHAGDTCFQLKGRKESDSWYIKCHQQVVSGFFETARKMLNKDGEIHVTHKTTYPYDMWAIEDFAELAGLVLNAEKSFDTGIYPGYENKKAYGKKWDSTFPVGECSTFMFSNP